MNILFSVRPPHYNGDTLHLGGGNVTQESGGRVTETVGDYK